MKLFIYNLLFPVAFLFYLPFFIRKLSRRGGLDAAFLERFGFYSAEQRQRLRQLDRPIWIHAVSVGEVVAALGFMEYWRKRSPELGFVLSTTTSTGYATARQRLPENTVLVYSPLDFWIPVLRALRLARPSMLVIFEVEIWPNLISLASRLKIPAVLVNGRLSDRSARGYARYRWFFRPLLKRFRSICVQSEDDAERVKRVTGLHAPVYVCNTMKFDQVTTGQVTELGPQLDRVFADEPGESRIIWVAGSTHEGEEDLILQVFQDVKTRFSGLKLVLVPRHCERAEEVAQLLRQRNLAWSRWTDRGCSRPKAENPAQVLLVDTTGELLNFYAAADLVYVGKSMAGNQGGHNIIEPALFAKPVIHGAAMDNFRLVVSLFKRADACREVESRDQLRGALIELLERPDYRARLGARARRVVDKYRGAMARTLEHLEGLTSPGENGPGRNSG